jgi:hypothetical protein
MRPGVWLWLPLALAFSGCQGDYPLEPTLCDRYCHATHGSDCFFYDPASCVLDCERDNRSVFCREPLDEVTACFERTSGALEAQCTYDPSRDPASVPCSAERDAYAVCSSPW